VVGRNIGKSKFLMLMAMKNKENIKIIVLSNTDIKYIKVKY
jgi:hypothetical protein